MAKSRTSYQCENCGHIEPKWVGKCSVCGEWNTFVETQVAMSENKTASQLFGSSTKPEILSEISSRSEARISSSLEEFDRVLGGGIVSDEAILISGDPGVGKSTLLMQLAINLSQDLSILYVSGEESSSQIALRSSRLNTKNLSTEKISILSSGDLQTILQNIQQFKPKLVVIDSIQTIVDTEVAGVPGGMTQVKSSASKLISLTKSLGIILIIVGHINKEGKVAGPKVLEHLVDCILHLEGDKNNQYRILRTLKNRFGSTGEVGIFEMEQEGLKDLDVNSSNIFFASESPDEIGTAKALMIEGDRPLVLDIQALSSTTIFQYPKRVSEGVSISRLQLLCAILESQKLSTLSTKDVYLKTFGGYRVRDYAYTDLSVIAALMSSAKNKTISRSYVFAGEVGLNGRITFPKSYHRFFDEVLRIDKEAIIVAPDIPTAILKSKRGIQIKTIKELSKILA